MDTESARELLREGTSGVRTWNLFRESHETIPDLSGANLSRCDLTEADLHEVCLCGAWLGGSILDRANLNGASLRRADLPACRFCRADLRGADLCEANLRGADVTDAQLTGADLRDANLLGVRISSAELHVVDLNDVSGAFRRVDRLFQEDARHAFVSILQKLDILDDLTPDEKFKVAGSIDDLAKELLTHSPSPDKVAQLLDIMNRIAPPLVAEVSESDLIEMGTEPGTRRASVVVQNGEASHGRGTSLGAFSALVVAEV